MEIRRTCEELGRAVTADRRGNVPSAPDRIDFCLCLVSLRARTVEECVAFESSEQERGEELTVS